jgi:hypothetical protein
MLAINQVAVLGRPFLIDETSFTQGCHQQQHHLVPSHFPYTPFVLGLDNNYGRQIMVGALFGDNSGLMAMPPVLTTLVTPPIGNDATMKNAHRTERVCEQSQQAITGLDP